jgi:Flp pilus assembly protein TadD
MSEPRRFPFGAVPVYNPQSLSKEEALAQFHARQATYQSLMDLLREEHPSHVLFIGTRGMGKTTLLQRVRYGVQDDAELNGRYLVLVFPEEQYNVNRLHHFLLNAVDALADAMERLGNDRMLALVETYAEMAGKLGQEEIEERVPKFLAEIGVDMRRSLLLLVDNADRLFETIEDREQWRLRELLSKRPDLTLFGATTQASEGIYGPDRAFFEFFQIQRLAPLTFLEVKELLLRLSESVEEKEGEKGTAKRHVQEWLDADAARLRTLVQLTGGNPRTTVLLFHLVLEGLAGGAREYLERLLDQSTPNYKGRVDELPAQAQQVLDAVALRWDPVTALEVAGDTGLETSTASTHLTRLVRQGVLEKADPGDSRKALYQVAERFFNIWYLMRASRRVRARLRWFVEFLRVFFDSSELEQLAWEQLERFRSIARTRPADIETVFAYLYSSGADLGKYEEYLRRECADKEAEWRPYVALISHSAKDSTDGKDSGSVSLKKAKPATDVMSPAEMEAGLRKAIADDPSNAEFWSFLGFVLFQRAQVPDEAESALRKAIDLDPKLAWPWCFLGMLLQRTPERLDEAESAFQNAIDLDPTAADFWFGLGSFLERVPERGQQAEAVLRKAIELDPKSPWFWASLGSFLGRTPERLDEAEAALRKAIELNPKMAWPRYYLGTLLQGTPERLGEAESAFRKAIELDPTVDQFWNGLGNLLGRAANRRGEAEAALRTAIELDPKFPGYWNNFGNLLGETSDRRDEAEGALRKAIELDPKFPGYWSNLGNLLGKTSDRLGEAEAALRKAIELDPEFAGYWNNLGILLGKISSRLDEAEAALRKAIDLDPTFYGYWKSLANVLQRTPERLDEAEAALRKTTDLAPKSAWLWANLGISLGRTPGRLDEAEAALRKAVEIDPKNAGFWNALGVILSVAPEKSGEAEAAFRRVIDLDPDFADIWENLFKVLGRTPERRDEAEMALRKALEQDPYSGELWHSFGVFLACQAEKPTEAEHALRKALELEPNKSNALRNLGVLLYCELHHEEEGVEYIRRAHQLEPTDPVSTAILAACVRGSQSEETQLEALKDASGQASFWDELLGLCSNYPPFGKILLGICDLTLERDSSDVFARLHRAVALAQLGDFPRASVALDDALIGDPIDQLSAGRRALEVFFAAAVRNGRVRDCLDLLDKKEWKDAWRPIYEALRAVEECSGEYLKRVAVEIREPAQVILRRIAPALPGLPPQNG